MPGPRTSGDLTGARVAGMIRHPPRRHPHPGRRSSAPFGLALAVEAALALLLGMILLLVSAPPTARADDEGAASGPSVSPAGTVRWAWPTPPPHAVSRPFEAPADRWSAGHRGIDITAASGSEVRSPTAGVVHFAGVVVDRPVLSIRHGDGVLSSFEPVDATVSRGDAVAAGQVVGVVRDGHCGAAACLHLGARRDGEYVSPLLFLGRLERAVLLPVRR